MENVEIERKFLIKEKDKIFASPFTIQDLKSEIKKFGRNITQHYLPLGLLPEIEKELGFEIKFEANEIRVRKVGGKINQTEGEIIGEKYTLAVKSKGSTKRNEVERKITKEVFDMYAEHKEKTVKKIRMMKKYKDKFWFIDYYPKYSLIIAEIEFKTLGEAECFKENMKEVTGIEKYKNRNLAE
jgi:CYTH domain-containing protein